ncbi:MAG: inorganic phosphate transporter [Parachlamydiales bacterium]|jgi:PiT family inorganic phosphate transporter
MEMTLALVVITVVVALIFDFVNGFHDSANSIATIVSTQVLKPQAAVVWAAFFNFIAMFIFAPRVADTIARIVKINPQDSMYVNVILYGLLGATIWDLVTWWWKLPTSSSHALIGGLSGAGAAHGGWEVLNWPSLFEISIFIFIAPLMGFALGMFFMVAISWIFQNWGPARVNNIFRKGQFVSAALYSIGHGANDAQKTMGIIVAVLFAAKLVPRDLELSLYDPDTLWIILSCQIAMALGTAFGGWRIVKTMAMKVTKLRPVGGFCAESAGTVTLYLATYLGVPVSTTHTIVGSIIGVGSLGNKVSAVKWGIAQKIAWAWILTIPASAGIASLIYLLTSYIK